jgi:hypothetical protein
MTTKIVKMLVRAKTHWQWCAGLQSSDFTSAHSSAEETTGEVAKKLLCQSHPIPQQEEVLQGAA